jgi:DNA-binding NtrC family response regulator
LRRRSTPSKSGYELCEHIRGSLALVELPILMTSEYASPEDLAYAEGAGANAFLDKPFFDAATQVLRRVTSPFDGLGRADHARAATDGLNGPTHVGNWRQGQRRPRGVKPCAGSHRRVRVNAWRRSEWSTIAARLGGRAGGLCT